MENNPDTLQLCVVGCLCPPLSPSFSTHMLTQSHRHRPELSSLSIYRVFSNIPSSCVEEDSNTVLSICPLLCSLPLSDSPPYLCALLPKTITPSTSTSTPLLIHNIPLPCLSVNPSVPFSSCCCCCSEAPQKSHCCCGCCVRAPHPNRKEHCIPPFPPLCSTDTTPSHHTHPAHAHAHTLT